MLEPAVANSLRSARLIAVALIAGVSLFAVVVVALRVAPAAQGQTPSVPTLEPQVLRTMLMVLGALAIPALAGFYLFAHATRSRARAEWDARRSDEEARAAIARHLLTFTILRAAPLEALALFASIIVLMGGPPAILGISLFAVVMMGSLLPAEARFEALIRHISGRTTL